MADGKAGLPENSPKTFFLSENFRPYMTKIRTENIIPGKIEEQD